MKNVYRICFLCVLCILSFVAGFSVKIAKLAQFNQYLIHLDSAYQQNDDLLPIEEKNTEEYEIGFETSQNNACVSADTDYYVYEYNKTTNKGVMIHAKLPESLDGATREDVENYCEDYNLNPSLTDRKNGFVNAFLISFSPDKMIVEKIFENELPADTYYVKAEENYVVIYCSDMITVYQYTDIKYDELPLETRKKIDSTMKLDSYKELISFLESYTS